MNKKEKHKDKLVLKTDKRYTMIDYLLIPFKACPIIMSIIGLNRIITAFIPSITVLVTAKFVDGSIAIFNGEAEYNSIFFPILCFVLINIYTNMNLAFIYNFMNVRYDMAIFHYVTTDLTNKRGRLEYKHIEDNETWNLVSRTCDEALFYISQGMNNVFNIIDVAIRVGSIVLILMTQVWWIGLIVIAVMLPMLPVAKKSGKQIYNAKKSIRKHIRRYQYLDSLIMGRENVEERSLFGYTDYINEKWNEQYEVARKTELKAEINRNIKMKVTGLITMLVSTVIVVILLVITLKDMMSIGMFIALSTATFNLISLMARRIAVVTRKYAMQKAFLEDLTLFMGLTEKSGALDEPNNIDNLKFESAEFVNVSFKYPGTENYILKDFNLKIEKNYHYAFVGVNGAGKTTITKILTGMYDNYSGEIYLNGINLRKHSMAQLKSIFSVVFQDYARYQIKVKDNIKLGNVLMMENNDDSEKINKIIEQLELGDLVNNLPNGLDTYLGKVKEGSVDISGGQWQRLAVARALYSNASIRILDEPTAALDPIAESNIYKMFGKISEGLTTIFITHRLGAAKLADKIVVLSEGKVAELGNHDSLISQNGIYASMYNSQKSWYEQEAGEAINE